MTGYVKRRLRPENETKLRRSVMTNDIIMTVTPFMNRGTAVVHEVYRHVQWNLGAITYGYSPLGEVLWA